LRISRLSERFKRLRGCYGYYSVGCDNISGAEQTGRNIRRLAEIYSIGNEADYHVWMSYSLARVHLKMQNYDKSRYYALNAIRKMPASDIIIKSVSTYFQTLLQRVFRIVNVL